MKIKYILGILYISIWIMLYFLPREFMHVGGKDGIEPWLIFGLTFFILPFILFKILKDCQIKHEQAKGWAFGSVFLIAPFIMLINKEDKIEFEKYKTENIGVITEAHVVHRRKRRSIWNVQAEYKIGGELFKTSYKEDEDKILTKGDTVTILYSSKTPQLSEILELINHYEK